MDKITEVPRGNRRSVISGQWSVISDQWRVL